MNANTVLRNTITDALQTFAVADKAGLSHRAWNDASAPHVFVGAAGFIGGRNRGRCPFFEIVVQSQSFDNVVEEGGTLKTRATLRLHSTGRDPETTAGFMEDLMMVALSAIRSQRLDNYTRLGSDSIEEIKPGPFGWTMDATMDFEYSYSNSDYEVS